MRRLGWAVLAAVVFSWIGLTLWVATDPCTFDCGDFGRGRPAIALWILSCAVVPAGAWLLKNSYKGEDDTLRPSLVTALGAKILQLFAFAMLLIAAYAAFQLVKNLSSLVTGCCSNGPSLESIQSSWRAGAVFSAFGLAWFGLIGFTTLGGARRIDRAVEAGATPFVLWVIAGAVSIVAFAGVVFSSLVFNRGAGSSESQVNEPAATSNLVSPSPGRVIGFLPASVADRDSGYEISAVEIEIRASNYPNLGNQYSVFLDARWSAEGAPREQLCNYLFLGAEGQSVCTHDAAFSFAEGGRNLERHETMTLFDSLMDGLPARAKISCQDRNSV